ncbi:AMP-binding protein [Priestia filamentosa]|nr:AMP-binding protein [Priestia filamentosa]
MYNMEIETLTRTQVEKLQMSRLRTTLKSVYLNTNFYRTKFEKLGINPDSIQSLHDVTKLPFTTKQDFRNHYPFGLFAVPMEDIVRIHGSSGTSGKSTVVGYTKNDIKNWSKIVARAIISAGGRKSDILHNAFGYGLFTGGLGLHFGAEECGISTLPISGGNTERQITLIQDFKPRGICGTPSYILNIAEKMEEMGLDPRNTSIEYGIFGAEPWSEEMRVILEQKFSLKAIDIYGLSEIMGPGVAIECHEAQDGLHIAEDHFLVEVIDPDTLHPVPDGKDGELIFTSLTKEALPIIRYRTGDIGSITRETCRCGRTTARMSRVKGRLDDMIIIRGVNVFPSGIERVLLQVSELVPYYQIHLVKKGIMDSVELHVEVNREFYNRIGQDMNNAQATQLKRKIQHDIKSFCLITVGVILNIPNTIPRSQGKAIRIIDLRKKQILNS